MSKRRFRDVKQGKTQQEPTQKQHEKTSSLKRDYASSGSKIKAFLTDSFMLLMPIMYVVIYLIMGSRENAGAERLMSWVYILVPLIILQTLFMVAKGQTPGYKAYKIEVVDDSTGERPSFPVTLFRNTLAILSAMTLVGWALMFFRKDKKNLHDLLSNTAVINKP
jgi:uncharacterized RDD family membrane protein YckC